MKRGDVVMIDWLYNDRTGSKFRPAQFVQADFLNQTIGDTILVLISRTARAVGLTEVLIDPATEPLSGLRFISVVGCTNLVTTDQAFIARIIGELSTTVLQQVEVCLKKVLGIP
jgi:mRNA-degrading endonuclease toxin of MazEF toxin-antitoxin module